MKSASFNFVDWSGINFLSVLVVVHKSLLLLLSICYSCFFTNGLSFNFFGFVTSMKLICIADSAYNDNLNTPPKWSVLNLVS